MCESVRPFCMNMCLSFRNAVKKSCLTVYVRVVIKYILNVYRHNHIVILILSAVKDIKCVFASALLYTHLHAQMCVCVCGRSFANNLYVFAPFLCPHKWAVDILTASRIIKDLHVHVCGYRPKCIQICVGSSSLFLPSF